MVAREPHNTEALLNLASLDASLHRYGQAQDTLEALLVLEPGHKEALYKAGQLYDQRELYSEAVRVLSRLVDMDSSYLDSGALLRDAREKITDHHIRTAHQHNVTFYNTN